METARLSQARRLFESLVDRPTAEQQQRLERVVAHDPRLFELVHALLAADRAPSEGLERLGSELLRAAAAWDAAGDVDLRGASFDGYRVLARVGSGGMGVVYLAEREAVGGRVALKVLREPALRDRFAMEQRLHAQLVHPSIPQFYGSGSTSAGAPYFALEYVEGTPLTEFCARQGSDLRERLRLYRAVCEAVEYAHRHALIHRDLKPGNILVSDEGAVRLLDFGIAKPLAGLPENSVQTDAGTRCFTPAYAAPEQHRGEAVDVTTDVYALGVVLYELLALVRPFETGELDRARLTMLVCEAEAERVSVVAKRSDARAVLGPVERAQWADLDRLVAKAMAKSPAERYRSVEALIRDLDHFHASEPLEARPHSWGYRTSKFVRRKRRMLMTAGVTGSLLIALTTFYVVGLARARDAAAEEAARATRVLDFMRSLMSGQDDEVGPSQGLLVETVLDRAVDAAKRLPRDPALQAEVNALVGNLYTSLGKLDRAQSPLERALESDRRAFGPTSLAVARDVLALSQLHLQQGKHDEAEREARDALALGTKARPEDVVFQSNAVSVLGDVLNTRGRFQDAIRVLEPVAQDLERRDVPAAVLSPVLSSLADAHYYFGGYDVSEALNRKVLALDRKRLGERHPNVADSLINLGAIASDRGRFTEAERLNREALEIFSEWHGDSNPETASALTIWARSLNNLARYAEAEVALQRAIAVYRRVYPEAHPRIASALNELGLAARYQGKLDDAQRYAEEMLRIERALHHDEHHRVGIALANLASVFMEQKRYRDAEPMFREALAIYARTLAPDHLNVAVGRLKLGRCLLEEKRYTEALVELEASYAMLRAPQQPIVKWFVPAARALIEVHELLGQLERAAAVRAELARIESDIARTAR